MTDASQPWDGVPLHPEKRRFHLLRHRSSGDKKVGEWWPPGEGKAGPLKAVWFSLRWSVPEHVASEYEYLGPLYTLAEAAALADAAAEARRQGMEEAIEAVLRHGEKLLAEWRAGGKRDQHLEGRADADDEYAAAIRAALAGKDAGGE